MTHRRPILLGILAAGALALVLFGLPRLPREPENYSLIEDGLYMGGDVARPPRGTRAVLNVCEKPDPYRAEAHDWESIPDAEPPPDLDWLRQRVRWVAEQRRAGRPVFVHCAAGASRSGLVVVGYVMAEHGWSRDEALRFVRSKRPQTRPNPSFLRRLQEWECVLQDERGQGDD
jgi:hypothetical protein